MSATATTLTPGLRRALEFIVSNPQCRPAELASHLWPDSLMHSKRSRQGHGACVGKAAWLAGGAIAAKLVTKGLVTSEFKGKSLARCYKATAQGRAEILAQTVK